MDHRENQYQFLFYLTYITCACNFYNVHFLLLIIAIYNMNAIILYHNMNRETIFKLAKYYKFYPFQQIYKNIILRQKMPFYFVQYLVLLRGVHFHFFYHIFNPLKGILFYRFNTDATIIYKVN